MKRKADINTPCNKRVKFFLLDKDKELLESGSKRKLISMQGEYSHFMDALSIVDEPTYANIKRRKLMQKQTEEYEQASLFDLKAEAHEKTMETEALKYEKLRQDFKDPVKRREILYESYKKLLLSK